MVKGIVMEVGIQHFGKGSFKEIVEIKDKFAKLCKLLKKCTTTNSELWFLLNCRSYDVFPRHIKNLSKCFHNLSFHSNYARKKVNHLSNYVHKKILDFEISDLNIHILFLQKQIDSTTLKLKASTSHQLIHRFLHYYDFTLQFIKNWHTKKHTDKLNQIRNLDKNQLTLTKSYNSVSFCDTTSIDNNNNLSNNNDTSTTYSKNKWFINLSNTQIPDYTVDTLSMGE